jgi:hypothetical protein
MSTKARTLPIFLPRKTASIPVVAAAPAAPILTPSVSIVPAPTPVANEVPITTGPSAPPVTAAEVATPVVNEVPVPLTTPIAEVPVTAITIPVNLPSLTVIASEKDEIDQKSKEADSKKSITVYTIASYDKCSTDYIEIYQSLNLAEAVEKCIKESLRIDELEDDELIDAEENANLMREFLLEGKDVHEVDGLTGPNGYLYYERTFNL